MTPAPIKEPISDEKRYPNRIWIRWFQSIEKLLTELGNGIMSDPWIEHAKSVILADYGVSVDYSNKDIIKDGRNTAVGTSIETLFTSPVSNETYLTSNLITQIISSSVSDTTTVTIEGFTVNSGNFSFVTQEATLNGQTAVTLATPLARCTNIHASGAVNLVGTVSVCETGTYTAGVPDTVAKVHGQILAGENQSENATMTTASDEYMVIMGVHADMMSRPNAYAEVFLEIRKPGKVFIQYVSIAVSDKHRAERRITPYIIVPPNSDVRMTAISDSAGGRDITGGFDATLLS